MGKYEETVAGSYSSKLTETEAKLAAMAGIHVCLGAIVDRLDKLIELLEDK